MLRQQVGIELPQLVKQYLILLSNVISVTWYHKQEQRVTLNVPQEAQTEATSLAGPLNDAWDVSHHE